MVKAILVKINLIYYGKMPNSELLNNGLMLNNEITLTVSSGVMYATVDIADYSSSETYTVGEYCNNGNQLYICKKNTPSPAGTFNLTYWEAR